MPATYMSMVIKLIYKSYYNYSFSLFSFSLAFFLTFNSDCLSSAVFVQRISALKTFLLEIIVENKEYPPKRF